MTVPKYDELINPLLQAMHELGGSASISEQEDKVTAILGLPNKDVNEVHRGNTTKLSYRLAWARNYLKRYGFLANSSRGVWALSGEGLKSKSVDKEKVKKTVQALGKVATTTNDAATAQELEPKQTWEDDLIELIKKIPPDAFERLSQRILRESGFIQVEVTGKSGDGGIDGRGVLQIGGLLSFRVLFQCKRFKGSVGPDVVRDFRGAMQGRADKGLIITTGTFTSEAKREAQRDGAPPIDLIDGDALVLKLKELRIGIGVKQEIIETIQIDQDFFSSL